MSGRMRGERMGVLPELFKIRQKFDSEYITDIKEAVASQMCRIGPEIKPGSRIAITAGSRGIDRIPLVIRTVAEQVKIGGGHPFVIPSMGSHGGATSEGQLKVLEELGITSEYVGAPILSSMEVVEIGAVREGFGIYMDRNAYESDGIIVLNRIKPHTSFHGRIESGLMKMMAVGLGKDIQARNIHRRGPDGLRSLIVPVAREVLKSGKIIAGIGLVENGYDRIKEIRAFLPDDIEDGETELLVKARESMPHLPVDDIDVLIVEHMGKNISGTGMDTNVIGRIGIPGEPAPEKPRIKRIAVLDLTSGTRGNALGIGLADFTTRKLVDKIDYKVTYANVITTTFIDRGRIPIIAADEEEALELALQTCGIDDPSKARIVRIKNTRELDEMWVSGIVMDEISGKDNIEAV